MIPVYRLWLHDLYGPLCLMSKKDRYTHSLVIEVYNLPVDLKFDRLYVSIVVEQPVKFQNDIFNDFIILQIKELQRV